MEWDITFQTERNTTSSTHHLSLSFLLPSWEAEYMLLTGPTTITTTSSRPTDVTRQMVRVTPGSGSNICSSSRNGDDCRIRSNSRVFWSRNDWRPKIVFGCRHGITSRGLRVTSSRWLRVSRSKWLRVRSSTLDVGDRFNWSKTLNSIQVRFLVVHSRTACKNLPGKWHIGCFFFSWVIELRGRVKKTCVFAAITCGFWGIPGVGSLYMSVHEIGSRAWKGETGRWRAEKGRTGRGRAGKLRIWRVKNIRYRNSIHLMMMMMMIPHPWIASRRTHWWWITIPVHWCHGRTLLLCRMPRASTGCIRWIPTPDGGHKFRKGRAVLTPLGCHGR